MNDAGRVIFVQPSIPAYRVPFFDRLAAALGPRLEVYASQLPDDMASIAHTSAAPWLHPLGPIKPLASGVEWQPGTRKIPLNSADTLVLSGAPRNLANLALLARARRQSTKTIWWGHYWSATSTVRRTKLRLWLMQFADAVAFYTDQECRDYHASRPRPDPRPVIGLNNGIETAEIGRLRQPYDAAQRSRDLLFVGRLTDKADLDTLLHALSQPSCAGITLDVLGDGPSRESLQATAAAKAGLEKRIIWHGASTDEATIAAIANRCRLFVYPGAVGLSLIHAFAYGLPAVLHEERWLQMPEYAAFSPGENGVTFARHNPAALAMCLSQALKDPTALKAMSNAARTTTEDAFNASDMAKRMLSLIESL